MIDKFLKRLKAEGWTQEAIGEKTGIPQTMISRYMRGKTCSVETLIKIAETFNVSTDTVLGRDKPEEPQTTQKTIQQGANSYIDSKERSQGKENQRRLLKG